MVKFRTVIKTDIRRTLNKPKISKIQKATFYVTPPGAYKAIGFKNLIAVAGEGF